ncbi:hypothetical protein ACH427_14520 [Streptomyces sp. NPDC020379]|uniref:hypothetical protein n=1 Tax=Streptomyces sp. NPDC020379 TaxID=3365071 RepID=UPI0037A4B83F
MRFSMRTAVAAVAVIAALGGLGAVATTAQAAGDRAGAITEPQRPMDNVPAPSCSDNNNTVPCWEYQTWYWTYDNCNKAGTSAVDADRGKFDNHVCALTGNGVGVGLWLHKLHD